MSLFGGSEYDQIMWSLDDLEAARRQEEELCRHEEERRKQEEMERAEEERLQAERKKREAEEAARKERIRKRNQGIHLDRYTGKIIYGDSERLDQYTGIPIGKLRKMKEEKRRKEKKSAKKIKVTNKLDPETGKYI